MPILALSAVATALTLGGAGIAQAATAGPQPNSVVGGLYNTNGTAGWYTTSFANTYKRVNGTFRLNLQNLANSGGVGLQLCNSATGYTAQVGAIRTPNGWKVVYAKGYLHGDPTGTGSPCDGNWFFNEKVTGFGVTVLGHLPPDTTVQAQIKVVGRGLVFSVADSQFANFNYFLRSFPGYFNEAAAGTSTNLTKLSAPAVNDLVDFTHVTATNSGNVTHGFAYWNAVSVSSSKFGIPPPLLTVTMLKPAKAVRIWHPGHRHYWGRRHHRRYRWVKGHWTSSGLGPSSFSILGGTPIGR